MICNEGYTIERQIHGKEAAYNDIQQWKFKDLVAVFGADPKKSKTFQVKTKHEAEALFNDKAFASASVLQVSETFSHSANWAKQIMLTPKTSVRGDLHAET